MARLSALRGFVFVVFLLVVQLAFTQSLHAAPSPFQLSAQVINNQTVRLQWNIADNAWLYKQFIKLHVDYPEGVKVGEIQFPAGRKIDHPVFGTTTIYTHQLVLTIPLIHSKDHPVIDLDLSYQGCSTDGHCFPPVERDLSVNLLRHSVVINDRGPEKTEILGSQKIEEEMEQKMAQHSLFGMIMIFLLLGVLLSFTPCILPTIPILSSIIVGSERRQSRMAVFLLSLCYVIGMALAYGILGLLFSSIGAGAQAILHNSIVIFLLGVLFVILSLSLFGLFDIAVPQRMTQGLLDMSQFFAGKGYFCAIIMGLLSALIITPCVTAPLIGVLAYIAKTGDIVIGTLSLFVLGLGMGIPLIAFAIVGNKLLPKSGRWSEVVKIALGFILLGVAVWLWQRITSELVTMLLWSAYMIVVSAIILRFNRIRSRIIAWIINGIAIVVLIYGLLLLTGAIMGNRDYLSPLTGKHWQPSGDGYVLVKTEKELYHYLILAKQQHKPVLIDFYASWCLDCRMMAERVFSREPIQRALENFVWIKVDVTQETPAVVALQKRFKVIGPPAYIFFSADGKMESNLSFVGIKSLRETQRIIGQAE